MGEPSDIESDPAGAGLDADDVDGFRGEYRTPCGPRVYFGCAEAHSVGHVCSVWAAALLM